MSGANTQLGIASQHKANSVQMGAFNRAESAFNRAQQQSNGADGTASSAQTLSNAAVADLERIFNVKENIAQQRTSIGVFISAIQTLIAEAESDYGDDGDYGDYGDDTAVDDYGCINDESTP